MLLMPSSLWQVASNVTLIVLRREEALEQEAGSKSPDSKVHGANMGPIWGRQDPGGPHVGPMNFAVWVLNPYAKTLTFRVK